MAADFALSLEAGQDVDETYAWYESQRVGLGEEFLGCVDACIQGICRNPGWSPIVYGNYRRALVRRFPYCVFFDASEDQITVMAVLHTAREPHKWRQRLAK
jgi:plasmid stabilization system protein ParE